MATKSIHNMRSQDSNIGRKTNKQYHQLEKNIFEKNHFSSIAVIESIVDTHWCFVKIIPTIAFNEFDLQEGYSRNNVKHPKVKAFMAKDITIAVGDIVLVVFTDVNFRKTIVNIINGKILDDENPEVEIDQTKHSLNFGIVTSLLLSMTPVI